MNEEVHGAPNFDASLSPWSDFMGKCFGHADELVHRLKFTLFTSDCGELVVLSCRFPSAYARVSYEGEISMGVIRRGRTTYFPLIFANRMNLLS